MIESVNSPNCLYQFTLESTNIDILPNELLLLIFQFLFLRELRTVSLVCKQWHQLTSSSHLPLYWQIVKRVIPDKKDETQLLNKQIHFPLEAFGVSFKEGPNDPVTIESLQSSGWGPHKTLTISRKRLREMYSFPKPGKLSLRIHQEIGNALRGHDVSIHQYATIDGEIKHSKLYKPYLYRTGVEVKILNPELTETQKKIVKAIEEEGVALTEERCVYTKQREKEAKAAEEKEQKEQLEWREKAQALYGSSLEDDPEWMEAVQRMS